MRKKKPVSDVFFDAEFKYVFQNFSIAHTFRVAPDYVEAQTYICELLEAF
jgi:hypothetical protein